MQSRALSASEVTCECKANASSLVKYSTAAAAIAMRKRLKSALQAVIFQSLAASCRYSIKGSSAVAANQ